MKLFFEYFTLILYRLENSDVIIETFSHVPINQSILLLLIFMFIFILIYFFIQNFIYLFIVSSYFLSSNIEWKISSTSHVLWLRELAKEGHWRNFYSTFSNQQNSSLLKSLTQIIQNQLKSTRPIFHRQECKLSCHLYSKTPFKFRNDAITPLPTLNLEIIEEVEEERNSHQYQIETYDTGIEESSCSPSVVIAGFAQSAVSIIYSLLLSHPQTLPLLGSGQNYLENQKTSCYRADVDPKYII